MFPHFIGIMSTNALWGWEVEVAMFPLLTCFQPPSHFMFYIFSYCELLPPASPPTEWKGRARPGREEEEEEAIYRDLQLDQRSPSQNLCCSKPRPTNTWFKSAANFLCRKSSDGIWGFILVCQINFWKAIMEQQGAFSWSFLPSTQLSHVTEWIKRGNVTNCNKSV
jgi:hypothetical protein